MISIPKEKLKKLDRIAKKEGRTRSNMITRMVDTYPYEKRQGVNTFCILRENVAISSGKVYKPVNTSEL